MMADGVKEKKRGAETKEALLMAGMTLFSEYGHKGTTTRMIADRAGANISAIKYHFGSKDDLYRQVILRIAGYISEAIAIPLSEVQKELAQPEKLSKERCISLTQLTLTSLVRYLLKSSVQSWMQIVVREQANPSKNFDILYGSQMRSVLVAITQLLAITLSKDENDLEIKVRAYALVCQVIGFRVTSSSLLRFMEVDELNEEIIDIISNNIKRQVYDCFMNE